MVSYFEVKAWFQCHLCHAIVLVCPFRYRIFEDCDANVPHACACPWPFYFRVRDLERYSVRRILHMKYMIDLMLATTQELFGR